MNDRRVILITEGEPETSAALDLLSEWAGQRLVHPFVSCAADPRGVYVDSNGRGEPSSVFEILGPQDLELIRVVGLCGPTGDAAAETVARVRDMTTRLRELAPGRLRVLEARILVAPSPHADGDESRWEAPEAFFDPSADANLVVIPEDRQTEAKLAIPLTPPDVDRFAAHVATEVATALGMWSGMSEAPVDGMSAGTIGFGDAKVHLVRSFVRVAEIPAVTLAGAADHGGVLRVPSGAQEAPYPRETIIDAQKRIESLLSAGLVKEAPVDRRQRVGLGEFLRVMGRGIRHSVRYLFTFSQDVIDSLRDMTGRILQEAVGDDSVLRVVWRGMPSGAEGSTRTIDAEGLMEAVRDRRALEGGVLIDQQLWADVGKAVFSSADGGDMPHGVNPLTIKDQVVIVKEVGMIAPSFGPDLADHLRADSSQAVPTTLLGRLGACLRRIEERSRREFDRLVERSKHVLEVEHLPALTPAGVVTAALATVAVAGILLLTGLVELVGVTALSPSARTWIWVGVTAAYALSLGAVSRTLAARFGNQPTPKAATGAPSADDRAEEAGDTGGSRPAEAEAAGPPFVDRRTGARKGIDQLPGFRGVLVIVVLAGFGAALGAFGALSAGDAAALGVTVALAVYAIALAFLLDRKPHRSLETFRQVRLLFFFTVIYGAFGLVGLMARDDGWYGDRRSEGFGELWIAEAVLVICILLLVAAMAVDSVRREKRARTRVSDIERGIVAAVDTQWAAEEAFEQFVGSAAAWASVIWKPFGEFDVDEASHRDRTVFEVLKAEARPFLVTPLGAMAMRERMMKELAKPGWLSRRYEAAVDAYRRRRAIETGEDPTAVLRPDRDPREVRTVPTDRRPRVSGRWRFMQDLLSGTYDKDLSRALATSDYAHAAEWAFQREGTLEASEIGGEPLDRYLGTIVPNTSSEVSYIYFDHDARPNAERLLEAHLWWPSKLIDPPDGQSAQVSSVSRLVNGDLAIMSVRHDRAGPYVSTDLFGKAASRTTHSEVSELPGEEPEL